MKAKPLSASAPPSTNCGSRTDRQITDRVTAHQCSLREAPGGSARWCNDPPKSCQNGTQGKIETGASKFETTVGKIDITVGKIDIAVGKIDIAAGKYECIDVKYERTGIKEDFAHRQLLLAAAKTKRLRANMNPWIENSTAVGAAGDHRCQM